MTTVPQIELLADDSITQSKKKHIVLDSGDKSKTTNGEEDESNENKLTARYKALHGRIKSELKTFSSKVKQAAESNKEMKESEPVAELPPVESPERNQKINLTPGTLLRADSEQF